MVTKAGSFGEPQSISNLAHFMEHLLVQGIPSYPTVHDFSEHIESLAGTYQATTGGLTITYSMHVPYTHLTDALAINSEVWCSPLFPAESVERERQAVLTEMARHRDSHIYPLRKRFLSNRYKKDSLLQTDPTQPDSIHNLTREQMVDYWKKHFLLSNSYLIVTGNIASKDILSEAEKSFGAYHTHGEIPELPIIPSSDLMDRGAFFAEETTRKNNYIDISFPSIDFFASRKERLMQQMALSSFANLRTSRLFRLMRYERGLVYGCNADSVRMRGIGLIDVASEAASEHTVEAITLMAHEIKRLVDKGLTSDEVEFVKHFRSNRYRMSFDTPLQIASWLTDEYLWEDEIYLPDDYVRMSESVTKDEINAFIKEHWDLSKVQILSQGPLSPAPTDHAALESALAVLSDR
jgi:predicted Zn-dependent peptidase